MLIDKTKTFYKKSNFIDLIYFLKCKKVNAVFVIGHSCKIDFEYFDYINKNYSDVEKIFNCFNFDMLIIVVNLISEVKIKI